MNNNIAQDVEKNLLKVKNKLNNEIIKSYILSVYGDIDFNYEKFVDSINMYIDNIHYLTNVPLTSAINDELVNFLNNTVDMEHIKAYHIQLLDSINFLNENVPKKEKKIYITNNINHNIEISESEFSKRYDELISRLNTFEKPCNLILQTRVDKLDFKVYRNSNNSIAVISGEEKSRLSFSKDKLISIVYHGIEVDYHQSYIDVLIKKILDNTIFDYFIDVSNENISENASLDKLEELMLSMETERLQNVGRIAELEDKFDSRQKDFENLNLLLSEAKTLEQDFNNAKKVVLEDIKVKTSYTYWEEQYILYNDRYWQYLLASIIMSSILLLAVFFFLKLNPLVIDITPDTPIEIVNKNGTPESNNILLSKQSLQIWEYGFLILFTTMIIWLIRIAAKITLSNYHLSIDANERVIMIKTYLSLIKEGSGYDENDKKVILDNIFRPTNFGIIKDETSVTITDAISSFKSK